MLEGDNVGELASANPLPGAVPVLVGVGRVYQVACCTPFQQNPFHPVVQW